MPAPKSSRPLPARIDSLTSLRFFAAAWVLILHISNIYALFGINGTIFLRNGDYGVDLFFILSGFILSHVYMGQAQSGKFHFASFLLARIARIWPVHAAMISLYLCTWAALSWLGASQHTIPIGFTLANLFLVHSWGFYGLPGLNGPSWSVSAEFMAYVLFPIFIAIFLKLRARPFLFAALAWGLLCAISVSTRALGWGDLTELWFHTTALRILPEFLFGCAVFACVQAVTLPYAAARLGAFACSASILTLAVFYAWDWLIVGLFGTLIFLLAQCAKHAQRGVMSHPWLLYLGEASYSLYMVHDYVLGNIHDARLRAGQIAPGGLMPFDASAIATIACVFLAMAVSYRWLELPARAALRRLDAPMRAICARLLPATKTT